MENTATQAAHFIGQVMTGNPFSSHGLAMKKNSRLQTAEQARVGRVSSGISHRDIAGGQLGVTGARELSSDPSHAPEPLLTCFTGYSKSAGAARSPSRARIPPQIGALESPREGSGGVWWEKEECSCSSRRLCGCSGCWSGAGLGLGLPGGSGEAPPAAGPAAAAARCCCRVLPRAATRRGRGSCSHTQRQILRSTSIAPKHAPSTLLRQ